jgi:hypothetical protein
MYNLNLVTVKLEGVRQLYQFAIVPSVGDTIEVKVLSTNEGEIYTNMSVTSRCITLDTISITLKPSSNCYTLLGQS